MADATTSTSSWMDKGTEFLGGIAKVYGQYESSRRNDLEYQHYDTLPAPRNGGSGGAGVPSWVWGVAAIGVVLLAVNMARA